MKLVLKETLQDKMKKAEKSKVRESLSENKINAIRAYLDYARVPQGDKITLETLNYKALERASNNFACDQNILKEALLNEDTLKQAADKLDAEVVDAGDKDELEEALDDSLRDARRKHSRRTNIMLVGRAGFGKSEMVAQWALKNNIHLYEIDLATASPELFGGVVARDPNRPGFSTTLPSSELLDELSVPNTVLFLDEYNRAKDSIRAPLHNLVLNRKVRDPSAPGGWRDMSDTLLFVVAALNPSSSSYRGAKPLEPSEVSRYRILKREGDPAKHLKYLTYIYTDVINDKNSDEDEIKEARGKLELAKKILTDPDFAYTSAAEEEDHQEEIAQGYFIPLNYRSFHQALEASRGKKDLLLKKWDENAAYDKKGMITQILSDYVDVDDKANAALKKDTESEVFKKRQSQLDKLKNLYPELEI